MTPQKFNKILLIAGLAILALIVVFGSFYVCWDSAPAEKTCASCHEIRCEVHELENSSHRDLECKECHGTALSSGLRSMKEKSMMIVEHMRHVNPEDVRMSEAQIIEVMDNCRRCHTYEYAKWEAGEHSSTYADIFLDSLQNSAEQLNYDCLRCHGMFYEGTIADLVEPISTTGPWNLKDASRGNLPTIPCLACHQVHTDGYPLGSVPENISDSLGREYNAARSGLGFYDRAEKTHFNVESLPQLKLYQDGGLLPVSEDSAMRNCVQCHAPNSRHEAGTSSDKTPRGVHAGLSCVACHDPHGNDARNSCVNCHPAVSNCKMDVTKMNTTYLDPDSPNDIHTVSCTDCHEEKKVIVRIIEKKD